MPLGELVREAPPDAAERVLVAVDCASEKRIGDPEAVARAPLTLDIDHHHDNTRFGDVNLVVSDASSTGEVLRDVFAELGVALTPELAEPLYIALVTDTGRFQYSNTTPKALRLAAELVEAGADLAAVFQQVYESVEFAKLKLLARVLERAELLEGGRIVVSHLLRTDFADVGASEPYSEGLIDYLRGVEGVELAVFTREQMWDRTRTGTRARSDRASTSSTSRRSHGGSVAAGTARLPASRATTRSPRSSKPSASASSSNVPPRALEPAGVALVDKPRGPSSFAVVAEIRRKTHARTGHAGTLDPFATGLLLLLSGRSTKFAPRLVGLDKRYLTEIDLSARTSTGDPEGDVVARQQPPTGEELAARLEPLRGEIELPIPAASAVKIDGERAYKLARRGVEVEMPLRRSTVYALDLVAYTDGIAVLDLTVSSGTYVRAIAEALGGHCLSLRRTEVGPFSVADAVTPDAFVPECLLSEGSVMASLEAAGVA